MRGASLLCGVVLCVLLPTGGGLQPLRPVRAHRPTVDARAVCRALIAPSSWVEEGSDDRSRARRLQLREEPQFEELSPRSTPQQREWPVSFADPEEPSAPTTSSFFDDDEDDLFDPFALPPAPEKVREGELGETRDETANGRTEGFYAALAEAPDRLRAADLNEVLQPDHLDRLRFTNFPLQAYGALFKWEVLVRDVLDAYRRPWEIVAEENGFAPPEDDEVLRAVGACSPPSLACVTTAGAEARAGVPPLSPTPPPSPFALAKCPPVTYVRAPRLPSPTPFLPLPFPRRPPAPHRLQPHAAYRPRCAQACVPRGRSCRRSCGRTTGGSRSGWRTSTTRR